MQESIWKIYTWWLTNLIVHNSKLSFIFWIDKVVCNTCTFVFCRLMVWLSIEVWKGKITDKVKLDPSCWGIRNIPNSSEPGDMPPKLLYQASTGLAKPAAQIMNNIANFILYNQVHPADEISRNLRRWVIADEVVWWLRRTSLECGGSRSRRHDRLASMP